MQLAMGTIQGTQHWICEHPSSETKRDIAEAPGVMVGLED